MASATKEGFRYAVKQPTIRHLLLIGLVGSVFGQPVQHLLPMFQDVLDIGPTGLGLLLTLMGVGALVGSTTAASLAPDHDGTASPRRNRRPGRFAFRLTHLSGQPPRSPPARISPGVRPVP